METEQQLRWLRERGCDELQGFLLGRPQPFETLLPQLLRPCIERDGARQRAARRAFGGAT